MSINKKLRNNHSSALKFKLVLSYLKADKTLVELSKEYNIHPNTISKWVKQFKDNGKQIFENNGLNVTNSSEEKEISNLYKKIGELTVERDYLKKVLDA